MNKPAYMHCHPRTKRALIRHLNLTTREMQVLRHILAGKTSKQIAVESARSFKTIESQRAMIMAKLKVHSIAEIFHYSARHGILQDVLENGP